MLPPQGAARHPVHRNELCVHPPAPALLSAAPFHSLVLPSFSLVCECPQWVTRAQIALWAPVQLLALLNGNGISLSHGQLSQSHHSEVTGTHQHRTAQRQQWGQVWDTQRIAGSGHCHSAPVAFPLKFLASLTNTEHPTQSTVTQTLPNACSE